MMNSMRSFRVASPVTTCAVAILFAAVAFTGLCGCTQVTAPSSGGGVKDVTPPPPEEVVRDVAIQNLAFSPNPVRIKVGERVRWTTGESGAIRHTSTSGSPGAADGMWDSDILSPGDPFTSEPFEEVGEFVYFCEIHQSTPAMRDAKVIVEP